MDNMYNISGLKSLEDFNFQQPYIASYQYNYMNHLLLSANTILEDFSIKMQKLYLNQFHNTQLIIWICISVAIFLILSQIPYMFYINSTIINQANLFLTIPIEQCRIQELYIESFLEDLNNAKIDVENEEESKDGDEKRSQFISKANILRENYYTRKFEMAFSININFIIRIIFSFGVSLGYIIDRKSVV